MKRIYTFWFGKIMSENRIDCLRQLERVSECEVLLITTDNLYEYVKLDHALHPAFTYLSDVHKSDYLRCYFMHHYGGGYSDVKRTTGSWLPAFKKIENCDKLYAIGSHSTLNHVGCPHDWSSIEANCFREKNRDNFIASQHIICKPYTKFTYDWYNAVISTLDKYFVLLQQNPSRYSRESKNGAPFPTWEGGSISTQYPILWGELLGEIFFPLQIKYKDHLDKSLPAFDQNNYK